MTEVENQKKTNLEKSQHVYQTALTALVGFILSVFIILISLIVLVRFWVFEHIGYSAFVFSFLIVGIIFNMAAVNLILNEYPESLHILPFVIGSPIIFVWTMLCIIFPFFTENFFSEFAQLPIATYDAGFYDGLYYNPNNTIIHPFAKPFISKNSIFDNKTFLIFLLIIFASK